MARKVEAHRSAKGIVSVRLSATFASRGVWSSAAATSTSGSTNTRAGGTGGTGGTGRTCCCAHAANDPLADPCCIRILFVEPSVLLLCEFMLKGSMIHHPARWHTTLEGWCSRSLPCHQGFQKSSVFSRLIYWLVSQLKQVELDQPVSIT